MGWMEQGWIEGLYRGIWRRVNGRDGEGRGRREGRTDRNDYDTNRMAGALASKDTPASDPI